MPLKKLADPNQTVKLKPIKMPSPPEEDKTEVMPDKSVSEQPKAPKQPKPTRTQPKQNISEDVKEDIVKDIKEKGSEIEIKEEAASKEALQDIDAGKKVVVVDKGDDEDEFGGTAVLVDAESLLQNDPYIVDNTYNQKAKPKKKKNKTKLIIMTVLMLVALILMIFVGINVVNVMETHLELTNDTLRAEFGKDVDISADYFLKDMPVAERSKVEVLYGEMDKPGEYSVLFNYETPILKTKETAEATVILEDTTAPEFVDDVKKLTIEQNAQDIVLSSYFKADDIGGDVTIVVNEKNLDLKTTGIYDIEVVATDGSGNKTTKAVSVEVVATKSITAKTELSKYYETQKIPVSATTEKKIVEGKLTIEGAIGADGMSIAKGQWSSTASKEAYEAAQNKAKEEEEAIKKEEEAEKEEANTVAEETVSYTTTSQQTYNTNTSSTGASSNTSSTTAATTTTKKPTSTTTTKTTTTKACGDNIPSNCFRTYAEAQAYGRSGVEAKQKELESQVTNTHAVMASYGISKDYDDCGVEYYKVTFTWEK